MMILLSNQATRKKRGKNIKIMKLHWSQKLMLIGMTKKLVIIYYYPPIVVKKNLESRVFSTNMVLMQTGLMGLISGIISIPIGNVLALVLIRVINERSFGWTIQFDFKFELLVQAVFLAVFAALLAGIFPAYKMAKTSPALALREE